MSTLTEGQPVTAGWTVDDASFAARLALVRLHMDWNLKEAARECGLPAATWRTWERDSVTPSRIIEICRRISTRTGCNFMWLLTGSADGSLRTSAYGLARVIDRDRPQTPDKRSSTYDATRRPVINRERYAADSRPHATQRRRVAAG